MVYNSLKHMGMLLDEKINEKSRDGIISRPNSKVLVSVIPANEELGVARRTYVAVCNASNKVNERQVDKNP